jgi:hypothetical protein
MPVLKMSENLETSEKENPENASISEQERQCM